MNMNKIFPDIIPTQLDRLIALYNEYKDFKPKEWSTGFRQALFLTLSDKEYQKFIEESSKSIIEKVLM